MARVNFDTDAFSCALREGTHNEGRIFENHCHPEYELIAVLEGRVSVVIEGDKISLSRGEAAIIPPLRYHSVYTEGGSNYRRVTALFGAELIPIEIRGDFLKKSELTPVVSHPTLMPILDLIRATLLEDELSKYESLVSSCLVQVLYVHTYKQSRSYEAKTDPRVKQITEYIDTHLTERVTLDGIAEHLFVSKSTVCHIFREEMKITVKQYVLQKKLSYAAMLIGEGASAADAAAAIGYENYANFYKIYKKNFGASPRRMKQR